MDVNRWLIKLKSMTSADSLLFSDLVNEAKEEVVNDAKSIFDITKTTETSELEISGSAISVLWQLQELLIQVILDSFNLEDAEIGLHHIEKAVDANQTIKSSFAVQLDRFLSDKQRIDSAAPIKNEGMQGLRVCDYALIAMQGLLHEQSPISEGTLAKLDITKREELICKERVNPRWRNLLGIDSPDDNAREQ